MSQTLRTAWVFSPFGKNFVKTMMRFGRDRAEAGVVADQAGTPTYAPDVAEALLDIAAQIAGGQGQWGVFQLAAPNEAVWAEVAEPTFAAWRACGGPAVRIKRIATADYPTPARRPANSRQDKPKVALAYGVRLRTRREAVDDCVTRLLASEAG